MSRSAPPAAAPNDGSPGRARPGSSATWRNWAGSVEASPSAVLTPSSDDELAAALAAAAARGGRIRPVGAGHSFSPVAQPVDAQLRLDHLTGITHVDRGRSRVRVRAGTPLHALTRALAEHGLALPNLGDIDRQTVAGATATGTHGTGAALPGLSAGITGLRLATPDGRLRWIDEVQPDLLAAAQVSLGALGVVTELELAVVPTFVLRATEGPDRLDRALADLDELAASHRHVELYWFPHTDRVQVKINDPLAPDEAPEPLPRWRYLLDDELLSNGVFGALNAGLSRAQLLIPSVNQLSARALTARTYTGPSHEVFCAPRRVRFHESEWAVPREALGEALTRLRRWIETSGERVSFPVEIRLAAADDAWLSTGYQRENAYLACHHHVARDPARYLGAVQQIMAPLQGRPHWGKVHTLTADELAERYPRHGDVVALRDRLDPDRVLSNPYLERVLGP